jgi:hypothetical protein
MTPPLHVARRYAGEAEVAHYGEVLFAFATWSELPVCFRGARGLGLL